MEVHPKEIHVYVAQDGTRPFSEWLNGLRDGRARAKIRARLDRVRLGNLGDCKALEQGVSELRIPYGPGYRVYFGQIGNRMIRSADVIALGVLVATAEQQYEYWADYRSPGS